jgi:hypothetical protein
MTVCETDRIDSMSFWVLKTEVLIEDPGKHLKVGKDPNWAQNPSLLNVRL